MPGQRPVAVRMHHAEPNVQPMRGAGVVRWGLPGDSSDAIEAKQAEFRA
jgi:hypothetical protein